MVHVTTHRFDSPQALTDVHHRRYPETRAATEASTATARPTSQPVGKSQTHEYVSGHDKNAAANGAKTLSEESLPVAATTIAELRKEVQHLRAQLAESQALLARHPHASTNTTSAPAAHEEQSSNATSPGRRTPMAKSISTAYPVEEKIGLAVGIFLLFCVAPVATLTAAAMLHGLHRLKKYMRDVNQAHQHVDEHDEANDAHDDATEKPSGLTPQDRSVSTHSAPHPPKEASDSLSQ